MADLPDWFAASVIKGWDGSALKTIKCATTGELYILLSALYNSTITALKSDSLGNVFMNVKAQDLAEVINRPKYGACNLAIHDTTITAPGDTELYTVTGKGIVYGGYLTVYLAGESHAVDTMSLVIDGTTMAVEDPMFLNIYGLTKHPASFFTLVMYDETNWYYSLIFANNITFETSVSIHWQTITTDNCKIRSELLYALV